MKNHCSELVYRAHSFRGERCSRTGSMFEEISNGLGIMASTELAVEEAYNAAMGIVKPKPEETQP